jgi:predicted RNase H-like HicB family nuclease
VRNALSRLPGCFSEGGTLADALADVLADALEMMAYISMH